MDVTLCSPIPSDAETCGKIMFEAFGGIADQHACRAAAPGEKQRSKSPARGRALVYAQRLTSG